MLRRSLAAALLVAVAWAPPSGAATLANLYTITVPADPAAADQREAATQAAMAGILVRVTGSRNAPVDPALQPLIAKPDAYLSSYGVDRQGRALVGFSRGQIERVLTELGKPVWGPERPLTLVAYQCSLITQAYIETIAVGEALPDMPLFLEPEAHVLVPLEVTYQAAWDTVPARWQRVIAPPA